MSKRKIAVLASGDPGFFGIAGYLTAKLGREAIEVIPAVSSMQIAFARIKESWDDAIIASVHARPLEDIIGIVGNNRKTGIFTDTLNNPASIAHTVA